MATYPFSQVDVFGSRSLAGNPVAVVHDATGLDDARMAELARWTNLSETTFLLPPEVPGADYRLRIFTPSAELPFAGHPSVGAAHTLVRTGRLPAGTLRQECGAGVLDVEVDDDGALLTGGRPTLEDGPDPAALAQAVGLSTADAVGLPAHVAGCGLPFAFLAVHPGLVDRPRPCLTRFSCGGNSFPEGPEMVLAAIAVAVWQSSRPIAVIAALCALADAAVQLGQGNHWPSDLVGAWLIGGLCGFAVPRIAARLTPSDNPRGE